MKSARLKGGGFNLSYGNKICGFLSFSNLMVKVDGIRELGLAGALSPSFLETTAEYFEAKL